MDVNKDQFPRSVRSTHPCLSPAPPPRARTISLMRPSRVRSSALDAFERLLWWLFAGSAGAVTRTLILTAIRAQPRNAQQLAQFLQVDYTTVRHHLRVLEKNRLVVSEGDAYGKVYFVSDAMESHWQNLETILTKVRRGSGR